MANLPVIMLSAVNFYKIKMLKRIHSSMRFSIHQGLYKIYYTITL